MQPIVLEHSSHVQKGHLLVCILLTQVALFYSILLVSVLKECCYWQGLRANLTRLYNTVSEESFLECKSQHKYQKLLFALIYFHSVLLERRKFRSVGLNIPYDFNDTDYKVSKAVMASSNQTDVASHFLLCPVALRYALGGCLHCCLLSSVALLVTVSYMSCHRLHVLHSV